MANKEYVVGFSLALFEIAKEKKNIKKFYLDTKYVEKSLDENAELIELISNYSLSLEDKDKIIKNIYKSKINSDLLNSMCLLAAKNKFKLIQDILGSLILYFQEELGIKEGIVYSTKKLNQNQIKKLETIASKEIKSKISLKNKIDKELISGIRVVIDDFVYEDSIKSELENIKKTLAKRGE